MGKLMRSAIQCEFTKPFYRKSLVGAPFTRNNSVRSNGMRRRGFFSLARASTLDLFDQGTAFGRLALVHVSMIAGDTLVTISLAGSLFFSVTPTEAKGKVLTYLLLTIAPFAVVSPILGPLIDRSSNGRRILVAMSAILRAVLCILLSEHLNSWLLFPEAFLVLVSSKLYVVTRGALVPEMARSDQLRQHSGDVNDTGWPSATPDGERGFAGFNAQLTLLGAVVGLMTGAIGVGVLKGIGATSVLVLASGVFIFATFASLRMRPQSAHVQLATVVEPTEVERDLQTLRPQGDSEVSWGLGAIAVMRFAVGFATFLLAFGLRRQGSGAGWFAVALVLSGLGALVGLGIVTRVRNRLSESTLLTAALVATAVGAFTVSQFPSTGSQVALAAWLGAAASIAQPSFDAITQRHVPENAQGRTFARFAVRQQLLWVFGALIPVAIAMSFAVGDLLVAVLCIVVAAGYGLGRRWVRI